MSPARRRGLGDRYGWNEAAQRYYDRATGRYVSFTQVRVAVDRMITASARRVTAVSDQLRMGAVDLAQWQTALREEIAITHRMAAAAAAGGWDQLTQADYGRIGAAVRVQYQYLHAFTEDIRGGLTLDGRFLNRAAMYAKAARPFYHDLHAANVEAAGYDQEHNVTHEAEHCQQCLDMSALGWVPIGTCIPIGQRTCLGNDQCTMEYQVSGD